MYSCLYTTIHTYTYTLIHYIYSISTPESIGVEIEKKCNSIFPLQNVFIRKVKVLKKPKFDLTKLMEMHGDSLGEDTGMYICVIVYV